MLEFNITELELLTELECSRCTAPCRGTELEVHKAWDTHFLDGLGLPPAKFDLSQIGLDEIFKNATKPCAWVRNSGAMHILDLWVRVIPHPSGAAIFNSEVQWALSLRPPRKKRNHAHDFDF